MSSLLCPCPKAAAITALPTTECSENFGQTQKLIITRLREGTTLNQVAMASAPTLATWTALQAAIDGTKVVVTPYVQNPEVEPGANREFGGGNATLGGVPISLGAENTTFTGVFYSLTQDYIKVLKEYACDEIGVYLINEAGNIAGVEKVTDELHPIPVRSFFVSDKKLGGYEEPDSNTIQFGLVPNWSDDFKIVEPTFDPLTEL